MTRIPRALFAAAVIAAAAVSFVRLRGGVATDLLSLAGERADTLTDIGRGTSAALRVLCADEARAAKCKAAFDFDESVDPQAVLEYYGDHGQGLLSAKSRELLENGEFDRIRRAAKRRDYSGIGLFPKSKDPFYFISDFVASLKSMMPEGASGKGIILTAKLDGPPDARQSEGIRRLVEIARTDDGVWLSGAPFHTFIATEATKREVNAIGALSIACVLALGWLLFRSFRFVVPTLLALGSGFVAGTSAVCLLPGKPHALTFLFGTALIGLGVDYCYHSLALRDDAARGPFVRKLAGAFATTSFAFAPLAFSTVGMLRQMSVFTIAGLLAIFAFACLFLLNSGRVSAMPQTGSATFAKPRPILMSIVIATAALGIPKLTFTTDPAAFHTPDPVMARGEAKFADMLLKGEGAFTVVEGQTLQEALEREEQMGVNGLSRIMPSLVRQKSDRALKSNVESFDGPPVYIEAIPPPLAGPASAMLVEAKDKVYLLSPYDLVWNNDSYYVFGWSEKHGKVAKFRVDRMHQSREAQAEYHLRPDTYDIEDICEQVFMMYDGSPCTVTLRCANDMMKVIVDRFGEDVKTKKLDEAHFSAEVEVSASPTFYAWLFTYGGRLHILSPRHIKDEYIRQIEETLSSERSE